MSFDNPSNHSRVVRIGDLLDLIGKSARSNRAGPDQVAALLQPVRDQLAGLGAIPATGIVADPAPPPGPLTRDNPKAPPWAHIREAAEQASLKDLTVAMAVYLNRIDAALAALPEQGEAG